MSRRSCCCPCWSIKDGFDRDDSTDLGEEWTELVGNSWMKWRRLYMPNGGEIAIFERAALKAPTTAAVELWGEDENEAAVGSTWRVLMNMGTAGVPGYWAQVKKTAAAEYDISVGTTDGDRTLETRSFVGEFTEGAVLQVCFTAAAIVAYFEEHLVWSIEIEALATGPKCGLANPGTEPISFANLFYALHDIAIGERDEQCPYCQCRCLDYMPPMTVLCTITADQALLDVCPCLDGATVTLEWDDSTPGWYGEATICGTLSWIEFTCTYRHGDTADIQFGSLTDYGAGNMCWSDEGASAVMTIDDCDPFVYQEEICCAGGESGCNMSCVDCDTESEGQDPWPDGACMYFTVTEVPE